MNRPLKKTLKTRFKAEMVNNPNQSRTYDQWLSDGIDEALKEDNIEWAIRLTDILFEYRYSYKGRRGTP